MNSHLQTFSYLEIPKVIAIGLLFALVYYFFFTKGIEQADRRLQQAQVDNQQARNNLNEIKEQSLKLEEVKDRLENVKASRRLAIDRVSSSIMTMELTQILTKTAQDSSLRLLSLDSPVDSVKSIYKNFKSRDFQLSLEGRYSEFVSFLSKLTQKDMISKVKSINLGRKPGDTNEFIPSLVADMTISILNYEEEVGGDSD